MLKEKAQELEKAERENDYKMRKMRDEIENLLSEREHFKEVAIRAEDKLKGREKEIVDAEIAKVNSLTEKSEAGKDEETSAKEVKRLDDCLSCPLMGLDYVYSRWIIITTLYFNNSWLRSMLRMKKLRRFFWV